MTHIEQEAEKLFMQYRQGNHNDVRLALLAMNPLRAAAVVAMIMRFFYDEESADSATGFQMKVDHWAYNYWIEHE